MSNLFRKEALEHRSRALFGEVVLRGSLSNWLLTGLVTLLFALMLAGLFLLDVQTQDGAVRVIDFLRGASAEQGTGKA